MLVRQLSRISLFAVRSAHNALRVPHSVSCTVHHALCVVHCALCISLVSSIPSASLASSPALDDCVQALSDGMHQVAEQRLVQYLAANRQLAATDDYQYALSMLCHAIAAQGRPLDVLALLDRNVDISALGDRRIFDYWRAHSLLRLGKIDEALSVAMPEARMATRTNDVVNLRLVRVAAEAYAAQGTAEGDALASKALDFLFDGAKDVDMPLDGARLLRSRLLARSGDTAGAKRMLSDLSTDEKADSHVRAAACLDLVEMSGTNYESAVRAAIAMERLPLGRDAPAYLIPCGRTLIARADTISDGASLLKRAIRIDPVSREAADAQYALSWAWLSIGSNELAAAEFQAYRETYGATYGNGAIAKAGQALALRAMGVNDEAASLFQKAAKETTNAFLSATCVLLAGESVLAAERYQSAAAILEKVFTVSANATDEGLRVLRHVHPADAADAPRRIEALARIHAADALERSGEASRALALYDEVAADAGRGNDIAETALYRAALLLERTATDVAGGDGAIDRYSRLASSTTNAPLRALAILGRGRLRYARRSLAAAISDFMEVEKAGFESVAEARLCRVYALYGLGRDEEALAAAEETIAAGTGGTTLPDITLWLGQYRYNEGDMTKAEAIFADFADRWPDDPRSPATLLWAAKAAMARSENLRAVGLLAALGERYPDDPAIQEARLLQGHVLCNLARFEDAVLVLDDAIAKAPAGEFAVRALIMKGDALFALSGSSRSSVTNALAAYGAARSRTDASPSQMLECGFKMARCFERGGDADGACSRYYEDVVLPYLKIADEASPEDRDFFEQAAFAAARLLEARGDVNAALSMLRHVADAGGQGVERASHEMARIRAGDRL